MHAHRPAPAWKQIFSLLMIYVFFVTAIPQSASAATTATPIKHLVVIFQENVSFDHYFGTYPVAAEPARRAAIQRQPGYADRERTITRTADEQSEL